MTSGFRPISAGAPSAILRPKSSTTIRSHTLMMSRTRCSPNRIVAPPARAGRRPLGDLAAEVEHDDPVAHAHDEPHEVLDHQDRGAAVADTLDQPDRLHDLRRGQPRVDLVEEQQPRAGRERARQLEASELHDREALRRRQRLAGEPDDIEGRAGLVRRSLDAGDTAAEERGDGDVVETGEAAEGLRDLERAADAEPRDAVGRQPGEVTAVEADGPRVGRVDARDRVDQGALAGAVGPDEPDDLARRDLEVHVAQRLEPAEVLGEAPHLEQAHGRPAAPGSTRTPTVATARARTG